MTHPLDDQLLLLAYGELPEAQVTSVESHLAACASCRAELARLEATRVALDMTLPPRRPRVVRWIAAGLAAAAVLAAVVLTSIGSPDSPPERAWHPTSDWSTTAGYVTGGRAMMEIDAQLTRLERGGERYNGLLN